MKQVEVSVQVVSLGQDKWNFEVTASNLSTQSVFVMSNATRSDHSKGSFISLPDNGDPSTLEISVQLYGPPTYFIYADATSVKLTRLQPRTSLSESTILMIPFKETLPPYRQTLARRNIDEHKIKFVTATIGIIEDDEGVRDVLMHKPMGPFVTGLEKITKGAFAGKRLIELQSLVSSPRVELRVQ